MNIAVTHSGICVYQGGVRTNLFSWARIRKLSFKRKNFFIKIHPEGYVSYNVLTFLIQYMFIFN